MARVIITKNLQRFAAWEPNEVEGETVREVLECVFEKIPSARACILDDQGAVRRHIAVFVNGVQIRDREHLSDPIDGAGVVYVMQALSGG